MFILGSREEQDVVSGVFGFVVCGVHIGANFMLQQHRAKSTAKEGSCTILSIIAPSFHLLEEK